MSMMDTASLILQIKTSGLRVDTAPLETVLLTISKTLEYHDAVLSKFSKVETAQCNLRKDLNRLWLAIKSTKAATAGDYIDSVNESNAREDENAASQEHVHSSAGSHGNNENSYGVRKSDIEAIHLKHAVDLSKANDQETANSLHEIKTTIRRLQQDQYEGLVSSLELCESIKSLKENLFEIQKKLASSASIEQMQALHQSLVAEYSRMEQYIQEFKTRFHEEVDGSINQNLAEVKSWFNDLEASVKQRQAKLEQKVASCVREYDVTAFRQSIESDVASLLRKSAFLDDTAKAQGKTLVMLQKKNAIAMFQRHYTNWKQNVLKTGISRWKQVLMHQVQYEAGKESQKRFVRKILTNIISRRKQFGFGRWIRYHDWNRKMERHKLKASTLICERLGLHLSAPKTVAFNRWRRLTLMDKMQYSREADAVKEKENSESLSAPYISAVPRQKKPTLCLHSILDSFKGDLHGAIYALALEIESIKSHDIASMRHDWYAENKRLMSTIRTTMDEAICKIEDTVSSFQENVSERVDSCNNDLPKMQSKLQKLTHMFESSRTKLMSVEKSHGVLISALFDQERQLEQRLCTVEEQTKAATKQVTSLFEDHAKSNDSIQDLRKVLAKNKDNHEDERNAFHKALNHFGDQLLETKVTLGHTQVRCKHLEKDLAEAKSELAHFQYVCQSEYDSVKRHIHYPGLPKPSLDRIVYVGHAYESLAKEKNYVTRINVLATLRTTCTLKMKRSEEKVRKEEEVDVPSEIVAFAHDYAAWVAYQADHESLLRLIAGTKEEQVFAEDDMISRRKELCDELKSEMGALLEKASSYSAVVDCTNKSNSSSSTRGLGLRWEARTIFLARVADATDAALSKHDQILLPASTRLGRIRPFSANVTVCVACDRPMRRKRNRNHSAKMPTEGNSNGRKEKMLDGSVPAVEESHRATGFQPNLEPKGLGGRPHTSVVPITSKTGELLQFGGNDTSDSIPCSLSTGKVAKATCLAESFKGNTLNSSEELSLM